MKKSIFSVILICVIFLVGPGCKSGFFGKFSGKVLDPESLRPLAGVSIRLDDAKYTIETDANGAFVFDGIAAGNHTITCKYPNPYFETSVEPVVIRMDVVNDVVVIPDIKSDVIRESTQDTLKLASLKPGNLLFRGGFGYGVGKNSPANNLVMVYNKKRRLVLRPSYLRGFVTLKDSASALEYARFFTGLKTFYLFRDPDPDNTYIEVSSTTGKPSYGEMPAEQFKKLGMTSPVVTNDANNYYVTRYVMSKTRKLFKVVETISFEGDYSAKKTLILTHMDIPMPPTPASSL
ncbi:MAG TPA: carboxypeptidase-like regulatory domain-containing protein [Bacteroidota bacterium]|nr:carboxypeptidase-like regulatory domain-containing protein [Bacteroidota bacterium]